MRCCHDKKLNIRSTVIETRQQTWDGNMVRKLLCQEKCQFMLYSSEIIGKSIICSNLAEYLSNNYIDMSNQTFGEKTTYDKKLEKRCKLMKELFRLKAEFKGNREKPRMLKKKKLLAISQFPTC